MLAVKAYPRQYVDACRARVDAQLAAYRAVAAATDAPADGTLGEFEHVFFNNMVLVLDSYFAHRTRGMERKDGNPMNEVRLLCSSMLEHGDAMTIDSGIKLDPETSVLGYRAGDTIRLTEDRFVRLTDAFFAEIERTFVDAS